MTTLRQFIVSQSALNSGVLVRQHLNNPAVGSGTVIVYSDLTANIKHELAANVKNKMNAEIKEMRLTANVNESLSSVVQSKLEAELCL